MSSENKENILALYHEIYTNLQTEADPKIIETLNELTKKHPEATFTELISSMKIYLLSVIEMMLNQQQPTDSMDDISQPADTQQQETDQAQQQEDTKLNETIDDQLLDEQYSGQDNA